MLEVLFCGALWIAQRVEKGASVTARAMTKPCPDCATPIGERHRTIENCSTREGQMRLNQLIKLKDSF